MLLGVLPVVVVEVSHHEVRSVHANGGLETPVPAHILTHVRVDKCDREQFHSLEHFVEMMAGFQWSDSLTADQGPDLMHAENELHADEPFSPVRFVLERGQLDVNAVLVLPFHPFFDDIDRAYSPCTRWTRIIIAPRRIVIDVACIALIVIAIIKVIVVVTLGLLINLNGDKSLHVRGCARGVGSRVNGGGVRNRCIDVRDGGFNKAFFWVDQLSVVALGTVIESAMQKWYLVLTVWFQSVFSCAGTHGGKW